MINVQKSVLILFLLALLTTITVSQSTANDSARNVSVDQICESYMDEPMSADSIYRDKTLRTTIEVSHVRKIPSLCDNAPQGTFTMNATMRNGTIVQCFCNDPKYRSVLNTTPKGSSLTIEGTYKSLTSSFFEGESKQCTITLKNCSFK